MPQAQDSIQAINQEILGLWEARFGDSYPKVPWPMICPEPIKAGLVVIGCNPAYPKANYYPIPKFNANDITEQQIDDISKKEANARRDYPYYLPFHRIASELDLPLEHVDLFFYRETSQEKVKTLILKQDETLNDFGRSQFELAQRIVALAHPKIILVANAFAAKIYKHELGLKRHDEEGLYWITLGSQRVPVFFSGMLSGQRPLDSHSRERLVWHMKTTLRKHIQAKKV